MFGIKYQGNIYMNKTYNILDISKIKGYKQEIVGFINIGHMKEISKKRMSKYPVATITEENFIEVQNAIIKNLDFVVDKKE